VAEIEVSGLRITHSRGSICFSSQNNEGTHTNRSNIMARKMNNGSKGTFAQHNRRMTFKANRMKAGTEGSRQKAAISAAMSKPHRVG
jgi:hypothetical protein